MPPSAVLTLALLPALAGLVFLAHGISRWRRWRIQPHWHAAEARVVGLVTLSGLTPDSPATEPIPFERTRFVYEYRAGESTHTAYLEQVPVRPARRGRRGGPLRVGSTLPVRYDPAAPERVVPVEHVEWSAPVSLAAGAGAWGVAAWLARLALGAP